MDPHLQELVLDRLAADEGIDGTAADLVLAACEGPEALENALDGWAPARHEPAPAREAQPEPPGAYLRSITVQAFRGIGPPAEIQLTAGPGLTVVVGRNGSGKSSFAEGLEMLLIGTKAARPAGPGSRRGSDRRARALRGPRRRARGRRGGSRRRRRRPLGRRACPPCEPRRSRLPGLRDERGPRRGVAGSSNRGGPGASHSRSGYRSVHDDYAAARQRLALLAGAIDAAATTREALAFGLDPGALVDRWTDWQDAVSRVDGDDVRPVRRAHAELAAALASLAESANVEVERRDDAWRPIAGDLRACLPQVTAAVAAQPQIRLLKVAEDWVRGASEALQDERMAPIADAAIKQLERAQAGVQRLAGSVPPA
jgi:hypothetical protein